LTVAQASSSIKKNRMIPSAIFAQAKPWSLEYQWIAGEFA